MRTNCLSFAIAYWLATGCQGRIGVLAWGRPFPHFAVFFGPWAIHYRAYEEGLPWWRQLSFEGRAQIDYVGPV